LPREHVPHRDHLAGRDLVSLAHRALLPGFPRCAWKNATNVALHRSQDGRRFQFVAYSPLGHCAIELPHAVHVPSPYTGTSPGEVAVRHEVERADVETHADAHVGIRYDGNASSIRLVPCERQAVGDQVETSCRTDVHQPERPPLTAASGECRGPFPHDG